MRPPLTLVCIVGCLAAVPPIARAQERELPVNLAGGAAQSMDVEAGGHRLVLKSFLPHATYVITIGAAAPVQLPPLTREPKPATAAPCDALVKLKSKAAEQASEEAMASLVTELTGELAACDAVSREAFRQATRREDEQAFDMPPGTTRTVVIRRVPVNDKVGERVWSITLKAPERGRWLTTYGVGFTPDRSDRFFLKGAGENRFTVAAQRRHRDQVNYIPAVFFTWLARDQQLKSVSRGWTAGLGFEADRPAMFGGYHWAWNQNIGLMFGAAVHQHKRLHGRYTENDVVTEALTDDQLHESVYAPNAVLSLTFRLGSNPFSGEPKAPKADTESDKKAREAKDKKAAEAAAGKAAKDTQ